MTTTPAVLASVTQAWADLYSRHQAVSVAVRFLHLAALIVGGGTALAADRQVLRALRMDPAQRADTVASLDASHRIVVPSLAVIVVTGLLMTLADASTFVGSRLYWFKMGLVGLLLLNGLGLLAAEHALAGGRRRGWSWLGITAALSFLLWLAILFTGVWLTVAA